MNTNNASDISLNNSSDNALYNAFSYNIIKNYLYSLLDLNIISPSKNNTFNYSNGHRKLHEQLQENYVLDRNKIIKCMACSNVKSS